MAITLRFALIYNSFSNRTADLCQTEPLTIERGFAGEDPLATVGEMRLTLHNPDGRYTSGHANALAGFTPGMAARLEADGVALFYGRLTRVETALPTTPGLARCSFRDESGTLRSLPLGVFPLLTGAAPREIIRALVGSQIIPPGVLDCWQVGHPEAGRLGAAAKLAGVDQGCAYDEGQTTLAWVGDSWPEEIAPAAALREVLETEWGRFFIAADGTPTFEDRHARPKNRTNAAVFTADIAGLALQVEAETLASRVEVRATPRDIGAEEGTIWSHNSSVRLRAGKTREIRAAFNDPDQYGQIVGAIDAAAPAAGTDFRAYERSDPENHGAEMTDFVSISALIGATGARLRLTNAANWTVYVHNLRLRGVPLRLGAPVTAIREDRAARFAHGEHVLRIDLPLGDTADRAADLATYLLSARREPHAGLTITLDARASSAWLGLELGDRIAVSEARAGLDEAAFFIEAIDHWIAGGIHTITLRAEPADRWAYFCLNTAMLGADSRLAY